MNWKSLLAMAALGILAGCSSDTPTTVEAAAKAAPKAAASAPAPSPEFYQASGPLIVENQVDVLAQREGVVARINAEVGKRVRKGDLLALLDDRQLTADRDAADAQVKSLTEDLKHWQALDSVHDADLSRSEALWKSNVISAQQVEHDRYTAIGSKFEIARQQQDLRNAEEKLKSLNLELEKTRIVAPFDGVVARRYIREGQRIANNDRMFWVSATAPLLVKFTLPQEFVGRVHAGAEVQVTAISDGGRSTPTGATTGGPALHPAKIKIVSPVVDPSSGTIEVQAQVVGEPAGLEPGMTVNIRVPTGHQ